MRELAALAAFSFAPLAGQTTWVVDALGGGSFTTIQAAVQAATDGDVVLVLPTATYNWTLSLTKSLAILGNGPSRTLATGTLSITGLRPDQKVVVCNFAVDNQALPAPCVTVNSPANVILSNVLLSVSTGSGTMPALSLTDCAHVAIHGSSMTGRPAIETTRSALTATASTLSGVSANFWANYYASGALSATASSVTLTDCSAYGGSGDVNYYLAAASAMQLSVSTALIMAGGQARSGGSLSSPMPIVVNSPSTVSIDSAVQLWPQGIAGGVASVVERGRVAGSLTGPGGSGSLQFAGPPGSAGALAVSFPGPELHDQYGVRWLDVPTISVLAVGALPLQGGVPVPAGVLRGTAITAQGILLHQGTLAWSPPLLDVVR
jgi:hypothetical protein